MLCRLRAMLCGLWATSFALIATSRYVCSMFCPPGKAYSLVEVRWDVAASFCRKVVLEAVNEVYYGKPLWDFACQHDGTTEGQGISIH